MSFEFESFLNMADDRFCVLNEALIIEYLAGPWEITVGYNPARLLSRSLLDIIADFDKEWVRQSIMKASQEGTLIDFEGAVVKADGGKIRFKFYVQKKNDKFYLRIPALKDRYFEVMVGRSPQLMGIVEIENQRIRPLYANKMSNVYFSEELSKFTKVVDSSEFHNDPQILYWISKYEEAHRTGQSVEFDYRLELPERAIWLKAVLNYVGPSTAGKKVYSYNLYDRTDQAIHDLVYKVSQICMSVQDLETFYQKVTELVAKTLNFPICQVSLIEPNEVYLKYSGFGSAEILDKIGTLGPVPAEETVAGHCALTGIPVFETEVGRRDENMFSTARRMGLSTVVCLPMRAGEGVTGSFSLSHFSHQALPPVLKDSLQVIADLIAITIQNKRSEEALKIKVKEVSDAEINLLSIIQNIQGIIFSIDKQKRLIAFNEALVIDVREVGGISPSPGMKIEEVYPEVSHEFFQDLFAHVFEGETIALDFTAVRKGKEKCFEVNLAPMRRGQDILGAAVFIRDVTDKVEQAKALELSRAKSLQNAKLASLGEMAAGIAHEINNPLAIIHGYASQLRENMEVGKIDPAKVHRVSDKILQTSERISRIIGGLRAFRRQRAPKAY